MPGGCSNSSINVRSRRKYICLISGMSSSASIIQLYGAVDFRMIRIAEERMRVRIRDLIIRKAVIFAEGQILVPGDHGPFVGALGIGVVVNAVGAVVGVAVKVISSSPPGRCPGSAACGGEIIEHAGILTLS